MTPQGAEVLELGPLRCHWKLGRRVIRPSHASTASLKAKAQAKSKAKAKAKAKAQVQAEDLAQEFAQAQAQTWARAQRLTLKMVFTNFANC